MTVFCKVFYFILFFNHFCRTPSCFFSSLFFCVVIFHSVLVWCCSLLFCLGCWRAPFSLLSEPFSRFFPSCLSLVTALIFFSTFVWLPCDRVFPFLSFIFCGHFSLSSSLMLSVLFCLGCYRAPFSLLSATFNAFSQAVCP